MLRTKLAATLADLLDASQRLCNPSLTLDFPTLLPLLVDVEVEINRVLALVLLLADEEEDQDATTPPAQ